MFCTETSELHYTRMRVKITRNKLSTSMWQGLQRSALAQRKVRQREDLQLGVGGVIFLFPLPLSLPSASSHSGLSFISVAAKVILL